MWILISDESGSTQFSIEVIEFFKQKHINVTFPFAVSICSDDTFIECVMPFAGCSLNVCRCVYFEP